MIDLSPEAFAELVADALDGIPHELGRFMDNVAVLVTEPVPPVMPRASEEPDLLGSAKQPQDGQADARRLPQFL